MPWVSSAEETYLEEEAVRRSLESAQPGDLLVLFGDKLQRCWDQIVNFGRAEGDGAQRSDLPVSAPLFASAEPRQDTLFQPSEVAPARPSHANARPTGEHND